MPKSSLAFRIFPLSIAFIAIFSSFLLLVTHQYPRCLYSTDNINWSQCQTPSDLFCSIPAISINSDLSTQENHTNFDIVCPWAESTSIASYIAYTLSLILLIFHTFNPKIKSFDKAALITLFSIITITATLFSSSMMVIDISYGSENTPGRISGAGFKFERNQASFIVNACLSGSVLLMMLFLVLKRLREYSKSVTEALLEKENLNQNSLTYYEI